MSESDLKDEPGNTNKYLSQLWHIITSFKFILLIGFLAFWVKIGYISSIDMWDEGWFSAIASRLAFGPSPSDLFLPLYYPAEGGVIKFFDKPPFAFWCGAFLMSLFGRTTFAAKGIVIIGGAGLAIIIYFLFSHQAKNRSAHIIAGLLVALAYFLTFYSRTAYIDPFVIFMGALVMLLSIRAVDAVFIERRSKKGYILLIVAAAVNILNLLTKAWQGILIAPAIVIYLLIRYIERHVDLYDLRTLFQEIKPHVKSFYKHDDSEFKYNVGKGFRVQNILSISAFCLTSIVTYLITFLPLSSLLIGLIVGITCYIIIIGIYHSTLGLNLELKTKLKKFGLISVVIASTLASFGGGMIAKVFYDRLEEPFIAIALALTEEHIPEGGGLLSSLTFLEDFFSNTSLFLLLLDLLSGLFGLIGAFIVFFFIMGLGLEISIGRRRFFKFIIECLDLIPLGIYGLWFAFWFAIILISGAFFSRDAMQITVFGVGVTLLLTVGITYFPKVKNSLTKNLHLKTRIREKTELMGFEHDLMFLGLAITLIIISFFPFVSWVQTLDAKIADGTYPWSIRVPGELAGDPEKPNPVTYTFLFFEYYIGWRYTHATSYELPESIGSALNDYLLVILLFGGLFVIGIYAFFFSDKRNPALGSALIAWLITIPFVFFPAQFQLNYYYIPLAIPYLAISAKGIEYLYSGDRWRFIVEDRIDRILAVIVALAFGYSGLLMAIFEINLTQVDTIFFFLLYAFVLLGPFIYVSMNNNWLKTFPGIVTFGLAYRYFIDAWVKSLTPLYNFVVHDFFDSILSFDFSWISDTIELGAPLITFIGIILLLIALYWLKPHVKPQALLILSLMLSAMLINVTTLAHYNQIFDLHFQEMSIYIKNHGGDYNHSTWVIPEAGSNFAMRYYLGKEIVTTGNVPFSYNSSSMMQSYYQTHSSIKFWVVINDSTHWDVPAYALDYPLSYSWLTNNTHFVCVDDIIGITSWYKIHLFVNHTWITEQGYDWSTLTGQIK
ncbi:ArnT family glycosyltransferase [Candidatus Hodarchaeum mangrovi]